MRKLLALFTVFFLIACTHVPIKPEVEIFSYEIPKKHDDYKDKWNEINLLKKKEKDDSANIINKIQNILNLAHKENNSPQIIKSHLKLLEQSSHREEMIEVLMKSAKTAKFPNKNIYHFLIAQFLWQYYEDNYNHYNTVNLEVGNKLFLPAKTYSMLDLLDAISYNYLQSLNHKETLQKIPTTLYDAIIKKTPHSGIEKIRPTLYDILAHHAVDFFIHEERDIPEPVTNFTFESPEYFSSAKNFITIKFPPLKHKRISRYQHGMFVLQNILRFHMKDKDPSAFIDADIKRLKIVHEFSTNKEKDNLYKKALEEIIKKYNKFEATTLAKYKLAILLAYEIRSETSRVDAYNLCDTVINEFNKSQQSESCKELQKDFLEKEIDIQMEYTHEPDVPLKALVSYRNTDKIYAKIYEINSPKYNIRDLNINDMYETNRKTKAFLGKLKGSKPVKIWQQILPEKKDLYEHETEVVIPELPKGRYALVVSTNREFSHKKHSLFLNVFYVTNLSFSYNKSKKQGDDYIIEVIVRDIKKGVLLKNVETKMLVYDEKDDKTIYKKKYIGTTNEDGVACLKYKGYISFSEIYLELRTDDDFLYARLKDEGPYIPSNRKEKKTYLFTDRSIYRPGQTVFFKGISIETEANRKSKPIENSDQTVTVHHRHFNLNIPVTTNHYGSFSGKFVIPSDATSGRVYIKSQSGYIDRYSYIEIEIAEYKKPQFRIETNYSKNRAWLDHPLKINGKAVSYAGFPLTNSKVKYSIIRLPYDDPDRFYYENVFIAKGEIKTDRYGKFNFSFTPESDKRVAKNKEINHRFKLEITVTDSNGETQNINKIISLNHVETSLTVDIPKDMFVGDPILCTLKNKNIAGNSKIEISQLESPEKILRERVWIDGSYYPKKITPDTFILKKEEYKKLFPKDVYNNENEKNNWKIVKTVHNTSFASEPNTEKKIRFNTNSWNSGVYRIKVSAKDNLNKDIVKITYFSLYKKGTNKFINKTAIAVVPLKESYTAGEKAEIFVGTGYENATVFLDIIRAGGHVERHKLRLNKSSTIVPITVTEDDFGNIGYRYTMQKDGRLYKNYGTLTVPWSSIKPDVEFSTFRNSIRPGTKENWKLKFINHNNTKVSAEFLISAYDSSFDSFKNHFWEFKKYPEHYYYTKKHSNISENYELKNDDWKIGSYSKRPYHNDLWKGLGYDRVRVRYPIIMHSLMGGNDENKLKSKIYSEKENPLAPIGEGLPQIRNNFQDTAFFFPQLETDENGEVSFTFTAPDSLSRWKLQIFAHTKDVRFIYAERFFVVKKELMLTPNMPRYMREKDEMEISTKITSLISEKITGKVTLHLFDGDTMSPVDKLFDNLKNEKDFSIGADGNSAVSWKIKVPRGINNLKWRIIAKGNKHSDSIEDTLPVISNKILVTESIPMFVNSNTKKIFKHEKLEKSRNLGSLSHHKLTLEFTSNPLWQALSSMPYVMEYPHECVEQTFSRFYTNALATQIITSNPKIKKVFKQWEKKGDPLDNINKNEELKSLKALENPWLLDTKSDEEKQKKYALLFNIQSMSKQQTNAFKKLRKMQSENGAFSWFPGMADSQYLTQHILAGFGKLLNEKIIEDNEYVLMIRNMQLFIDNKMFMEYMKLKKDKKLMGNNIHGLLWHYLYARSFFTDYKMEKQHEEAFDYWKEQAKKYWPKTSVYMKALAAKALFIYGEKEISKEILKSLKNSAINEPENGMYWESNTAGYSWSQSPIETQATAIDAFNTVLNDNETIEKLKLWLLRNKQTNHWRTTKATVEAIHALISTGNDWLANDKLVKINIGGNEIVQDSYIADTGYFKKSWNSEEIKPEMGNIKIENPNNNPSYGALYWQYFQDLENITPYKTDLVVKKQVFLKNGEELVSVGENMKISFGDRLIVRIEVKTNRDMDYIYIKDQYAAGFEPENTLASSSYQNGAYIYEVTRDSSTNFFIDHLPKGRYIFEYPLKVNVKGNFSNGITTIQSMYAPEFTSHTEGSRIRIE